MVYGVTGKEDLEKIVSVLERHGVLTIEEIAKYTKLKRQVASRRVGYWHGMKKLFRVARNQYALSPDATPRLIPSKKDMRTRRRNPEVELMYQCFNNMVRAGA
jgi:hypothetical protein